MTLQEVVFVRSPSSQLRLSISSYWSHMGGKLSGTYMASFIHPITSIHLSDVMLINMISNASGTTQGSVSCPRTGGARDQSTDLPVVR